MVKEYDFQMVSLNVRGLGNHKKRTSVFNWITKKKFDVIYLQETHSTQELEQLWKNEWKGRTFMSHGTSNSKGCMILFKQNLDIDIQEVKCDDDGRFIIIDCEIMDKRFILANVYAPNTEDRQVKFIRDLEHNINQFGYTSDQDFIMGGDWNIVRDASVVKQGGISGIKHMSVDQMDTIMNNLNLNDSWRIKNPHEKRFTWRQKSPLIQCRID